VVDCKACQESCVDDGLVQTSKGVASLSADLSHKMDERIMTPKKQISLQRDGNHFSKLDFETPIGL
jgi:hypothetical protein